MQSHDRFNPFGICLTLSHLLIAAIIGLASTASADERQSPANPTVQDIVTADIAGQLGPQGIRYKNEAYRRWVKETADDGSPARYLLTGFCLSISPAYVKGAVYEEWQPAVFLNLHLEYDLIRYFGTYSGLLSFPDKYAKFGRIELRDLKGKEETATGQRISFQPTLYAKLGPVIIANQTDLSYYRFNGRGPYFLEMEYDTLLKKGDYLIDDAISFMVPAIKGQGADIMYLGPFYNITHSNDAGITRHRAGGRMYWVMADKKWGMTKPRIYSQAAYNIEDRNRKGQINFAIGFAGDLIP
jgi:hypothetical protein